MRDPAEFARGNGKEVFTRRAAPFASDSGLGVAIDSSNNIFLTGITQSAIDSGQTHAGGSDAYVTKLDSSGTLVYNKRFGTSGSDRAPGVAVNGSDVYISGETEGTPSPARPRSATATPSSSSSTPPVRYQYAHQFGGGFNHRGSSIAFDADGTSVLTRLGPTNGSVPVRQHDSSSLDKTITVAMETTARVGQSFFIKINDGPPRRIIIEATDSLDLLASRISNLLGADGDATMADGAGAKEHLEIQTLNNAVIEILAGPEGFDALKGLGLEPQRLIGKPSDAREEDDTEFTGY